MTQHCTRPLDLVPTPPKTRRVKTGCRTCKIRKVKCDEGRPVCHRCLSTGRVCEGYSIWGGGNKPVIPSVQNRSRQQHQGDEATSSNPKIAIPPVNPAKRASALVNIEDANAALHLGVLRRFPCHVLPADQHAYMEWFVQRTAQKLPGAFDAPFWRTLLPQASRSEPAVLHAVLTLGSIHKRAVLGVGPCSEMSTTDAAGLFTLQQYTLATGDLRCRIETKGKTSVRVALITCAVFVQLEYLRGCYKIALTHLRHGLTLLEECLFDASNDNTSTGQGCWGWDGHRRRGDTTETDESILHTFMFLLIQARLLGQLEDVCHTRLLHLIVNSDFEPMGAQFQSLMHARTSLEHILLQIFCLIDETRPGGSGSESESGRCGEADPDPDHHGHTHQPLSDLELYRIASIQENLDRWLKAYQTTTTTTTTNPRHQFSGVDRFALGLLQLYHTMACAMLQECLDCLCLPSSAVSDISPRDILHSFSSTSSPPSSAMLSTTTTSPSSSPPPPPPSSSSFHNTNTSSQGHTPTTPQPSSPSSYTTPTSTTPTSTSTNPQPQAPTRTGNDLYTSILRQSTHLYSVVTHPPSLSDLPIHVLHPLTINESAATSIADLGWLPPLFYTALHARDIPTRAEAIRLLPLKPHREGIWDSCTAATITQKILDLERRSLVVSPSPPLGETRQNQNQNLPALPPDANTKTHTDTHKRNTVPAQYKLRNLQIELPAEADGKLVLTYRYRTTPHHHHHTQNDYSYTEPAPAPAPGGGCCCWTSVNGGRAGRSTYDLKTGLWTDE